MSAIDWDAYWERFVRSELSPDTKRKMSIHTLREVGKFFESRIEAEAEAASKFKWQVRDTCKRAEAAEAALATAIAALRELREIKRFVASGSAIDAVVVGARYERGWAEVDRILAAADRRAGT